MTQDDRIYLRPMGILDPSDAGREIEAGHALPLAGGPRAFTLLEVIRRTATGLVRRRTIRVTDDAHMTRLVGEEGYRNLTQARSAMCDLTMARPHVMGVLNVTPDSFSDGGRFADADTAITEGIAMAKSGAHIIDVGGESTRPGAEEIAVEEECARVIPVIEGLVAAGVPCVSIDTRKARVMEAAVHAGAHIINDVSALTFDEESVSVAAKAGVPVVLMHAQGTPQDMQHNPTYEDVVLDVYDHLRERVAACVEAGIDRAKVIVDPGIGFGKTVAHNIALLSDLSVFHGLGCPLLVGASRKRFIGALNDDVPADERLPGSLAALKMAVSQGAQFHRVHDVAEVVQALRITESIAHNLSKD